MNERDGLAHALMMKFGLAPGGPNNEQLDRILADIARIKATGRAPTDADWRASVQRHVPQAGKYFYGGEDFSDLNALFAQAVKQAKK